MTKVYVKPPKMALKAGLIVGILFFLGGILFISLLIGEPESYIGIGFLTFWLVVIGIIIRTFWVQLKHYDNPEKGSLNSILEVESDFANSPTDSNSFDEKLRKIEHLKNEGLLSDDEYERKRKEVLDQKW